MASLNQIHKKWAKKLTADAKPAKKADYRKFCEEYPDLKSVVTESKFIAACGDSEEVEALNEGAFAICYYFTNEYKEELEFENEHKKTVWQTVKANANYYSNLIQFIEDEKDPEYLAIYDKVQKDLRKYFELAAEDILEEVYGKEYTDFVAAESKSRSSKSSK